MQKKLILILGGARSGKSVFAEELARRLADKVLYVATAQAGDEEMRQRITWHRRHRPAGWQTLEVPTNIGAAIATGRRDAEVVVVDCLTLLIANVIMPLMEEQGGPRPQEEVAAAVSREVADLLHSFEEGMATFVVISNEVGLGLVPPFPLGRAYRDLLGRANQELASRADQVYFLVAGIPLELKALGTTLEAVVAGLKGEPS